MQSLGEIKLPTEVSEGFFTFAGHYFGELIITDKSIYYSGNRRTFLLKKVPLIVSLSIDQIQKIEFKHARFFVVILRDGKKFNFMIGESTINEFGSSTIKEGLGNSAAPSGLYDIARTKQNEAVLSDLKNKLSHSTYSQYIDLDQKSVKTSSVLIIGILIEYGIRVLVFLSVTAAIAYSIIKYT